MKFFAQNPGLLHSWYGRFDYYPFSAETFYESHGIIQQIHGIFIGIIPETMTQAKNYLSRGGIPNDLLALGKPDDVKECVRKVIETVGRNGGYICDASAIMQDDTKPENLRAMGEAARQYGEY